MPVAQVSVTESNPNEECEVQEILDECIGTNKTKYYKIRWKGYSPNSDTWEPEDNLFCPELLENFFNQRSNLYKMANNKGDDVDVGDVIEDDDKNGAHKNSPVDEDYRGSKIKLSSKGTRASSRLSKVPICFVCGITSDGVGNALPNLGMIFCSVECIENYKKRSQI